MTITITKEFDPYYIELIDDVSSTTAKMRLDDFVNTISASIQDKFALEDMLIGKLDYVEIRIWTDEGQLRDIYHIEAE
jgi:hypothetical protein